MERMTAAEYRAQVGADAAATADQDVKNGRKRVRGADPVEVDGIRFHSKREARRWAELRLLQAQGEISGLRRQVPILLHGRDGPILTPTGKNMVYIADFVYIEGGREIVEDAKGHPTEVFLIKKAILAAQGIEVREV